MQDRGGDEWREVLRHAACLGAAIREERQRRGITMTALAAQAGVALTTIHDVEAGEVASLQMYVRIGRALKLRREFALLPGRAILAGRAEDPVHAAMGEIEARSFRSLGCHVGLDEPFQHYQFAGRVDAAVWTLDPPSLLAIENRTRFPNVQETAGSFNAKWAYFGAEMARRAGVDRWPAETHVIVTLWSGEVLHDLRLRRASFEALCPDEPDAWAGWWNGAPPTTGRRRILVVFDPLEGRRHDRARWVAGEALGTVRPRYRDYAAALAALREAGLA